MAGLTHDLRLADPDDFYVELIGLYDGLDEIAAEALSARLILLLCNQIGDRAILSEAFQCARSSGHTQSSSNQE